MLIDYGSGGAGEQKLDRRSKSLQLVLSTAIHGLKTASSDYNASGATDQRLLFTTGPENFRYF